MNVVSMKVRDACHMLAVIVNYRTGPLVLDCLASLESEVRANPGLRVMVIDNASGDGSAELIRHAIADRGWAGWAELIASPSNGGFACGNNLAIRVALGRAEPLDHIWLLNPDTVVRPGTARIVATFMRSHARAGIVGTGLEDGHGKPLSFAFRFPTILSEIERGARWGVVSRLLSRRAVTRRMPSRPDIVDWVCGASMVIRRELLDEIGLMDEAYFLYYEETDFCLQAQRAGWECWYLPEATVLHIAGQSTGVTGGRTINRRMPGYWFESRRHYFIKNHGRPYAVLADLGWLATHLLWMMRQRVLGRSHNEPPRLVRDFLSHSAILRGG